MMSNIFLLSWATFLWQKAECNTDNAAASLTPVFRSWPLLKLLPASGIKAIIWLFYLEERATCQKETQLSGAGHIKSGILDASCS